MIGERVSSTIVFRDPSAFTEATPADVRPDLSRPITRNDDYLAYLTCMRELTEATKKPWPLARQEAERWESETERAYGGTKLNQIRHALTNLLRPVGLSMFTAVARSIARRDTADAGIAAELYRRDHGEFPAKLEELVPDYLPALPLDPFGGQPLRFRVDATGQLLIYSIGENGVDDRGGSKATGYNQPPDIVFAVEPAAKP
jgi:hypothetical protein